MDGTNSAYGLLIPLEEIAKVAHSGPRPEWTDDKTWDDYGKTR